MKVSPVLVAIVGVSAASAAPPARTALPFRTAHWKTTSILCGHKGEVLRVSEGEFWARAEPPLLFSRTVSDRVKGAGNAPDHGRRLIDSRGTLTYDGARREWTFSRFWSAASEKYTATQSIRDQIRNLILPPALDRRESPTPTVQITAWSRPRPEKLGVRRVLRSQREIRQRFPPEERYWVNQRSTVWTDPDNGRVVRKQVEEFYPKSKSVTTSFVTSGIVYDGPIESGTLDLAPARDAVVWDGHEARSPQLPVGMDNWSTLSAEDQREIQGLIDRSEAGWRQGDFDAFQRGWEFVAKERGHPNRAFAFEPAAQWRSWVEAQRGRWTEWRSRCEAASRFRLPAYRMGRAQGQHVEGLRVFVRTQKRLAGEPWTLSGYLSYTLAQMPNGWRIVDWSWRPLEERYRAR